MKHWLRLVGAGGLGVGVILGASIAADAAPIIDSWTYTLNNAFMKFDPNAVVGSGSNASLGGATRIEWPAGFGGERSALEVEHDTGGVVTGTVRTNGAVAPGPDLLHVNKPVPADLQENFLLNGRLVVEATLAPADPAISGSPAPFRTFFDFMFKETRNQSDCGFESQSVCDDIFLLVGTGDSTQQFEFQDELYTLRLGSERLASLSPEQCAEVGEDAGCNGFLTRENGATTFGTFISVTASETPIQPNKPNRPNQPVPVAEPSALAMLGAGLVALGFIGRRRKAH